MSRRSILILCAAGLVLVIMAWLVRGLAYSLLVVPVQFVIYYARALYLALPHTLLWGILLIFIYMIAVNSLYRRRSALEQYRLPRPIYAELRITQLARYIAGRQRPFYRHRLKFVLTELAIQAIIQKKRISSQEVRNLINRKELDVPPEMQTYFKDGLLPWAYGSLQSPGLLVRLFQFRRKEKEADDLSMKVLEYIEEQMEIERDGNSPSL